MLTYLVRRCLIGVITLFLIMFVVYGMIRNMPGTPLTLQMAETDPSKVMSDEDLEIANKTFGLDKHWTVGYVIWLGNIAQFDLGRSIPIKQPVAKLIAERAGPTLLLSVTSLILAYLLAVPMGLFATVRSGKLEERGLALGLYMLYSLPSYVAALMLLVLFAVKLDGTFLELPLMGMKSDGYEDLSFFGKTWDIMKHMILPVTCFTYGSLAYYTRFVKSNMEEVVRQDFIRTARAKGVGQLQIIWHHAFRNTLIPFVTLMGLTLPGLLSGAVILERVFTWPGMGQLFFDSILARDYPTLMGLMLMFSVLTLMGQLLADLLYAVVDPRISYS